MSPEVSIVSPAAGVRSKEKSGILLTVWRRLSQVAFLGILGQWSFYGIFRCPFIVPYVSCENCPVITCHGRILSMFWGFWLLLPLSVVLFGRAFCGWACPGGLVNQLLGKIAPLKLRVRHLFTRVASWGKYPVLALAIYVWLLAGQPRSDVPIRVGEFFPSVGLTFEHAGLFWLVRTGIVLGFLVLGLIAANAWCRFACPTGGVLELLKPLSFFKIYKNERCNGCDQCLQVCEMGTRPAEANCTNCGDCLNVCPTDAIQIGRKK
ncbi:MAG: 4Fe-4S binding protein [Syntrophobacterales bacterium]|jgi:polyferredoxin|nr:4Fe-4S binding protein [Syntrophobacterales bacterium]